ncbi:drug/metabolite transporter superfamily permease [Acetobacter nitrogenifigens DSM 23921 = NBRC 105050]|uniref:Transporter n=1 Tax=Acetobacter nitrogenifigens DSM 23921 = NBRC 105050 TaxID=1120919 RepID=A0A511XAS7_9PROT|nr:DMT family transporter [Acetobacter nitrogenifigens]GBQ90880.1 drug/metabolite transporter superfamily permease [Acetobacter nitrogenifigens DSM 23921 = NBRC 105050]GEN60063.1 transporter [Acetobacter nitrogenifigens DSM 23921 = NBRC 105050]
MKTSTKGFGSGLLGVLIFSGSLPATRLAVSGFSPLFLTAARALIAAALGALLLAALRERRPARPDLPSLGVVALGVVIGFPLLTALALRHITSAHSLVFIGLLPLATALFGVLRGGERPGAVFWAFSLAGAASVAGFALTHGGGGSVAGDTLMLAAVALCGLGYAEGAALSRRLGGWQVISWALVLASPAMAALALATEPGGWAAIGSSAWMGLAYVSVFSMLVGFIFWYRGLALGGIASVGQLQLLQPFFGLILAHAVLGEAVSWAMCGVTMVVVACVAGARRYA